MARKTSVKSTDYAGGSSPRQGQDVPEKGSALNGMMDGENGQYGTGARPATYSQKKPRRNVAGAGSPGSVRKRKTGQRPIKPA